MSRLYGKPIVKEYKPNLDFPREVKAVVVQEDDYYNLHIIDSKYREDEINTLYLQEPAEDIKDACVYFSDKYMLGRIMEHLVWDIATPAGVTSASVIIHEIETD